MVDTDSSFAWIMTDLTGERDERDCLVVAIRRARLPLTTVALAVCLLARLSPAFERTWRNAFPHDYTLCVAVSCLWLAQRSMDDAPYNLRSWVDVVSDNVLTREMLKTTEALIFRYRYHGLRLGTTTDVATVISTLLSCDTATNAPSPRF